MTFLSILCILFGMIASHFICDYVLQSDAIAIGKNQTLNDGVHLGVPWYYWLTAHSITHSVGVFIVLFPFIGELAIIAALLEFIMHFMIDDAKCHGLIDIHDDQLMHGWAKLIILFLVV